MPNDAHFGALVKRWRESKDLTQDGLAREAGVDKGTISRIERGKGANRNNRKAVIDVLRIPQHELEGRPAPNEPISVTLRLVAESAGVSIVLGEWIPKQVDLESLYQLNIGPTVLPAGSAPLMPQRPSPELPQAQASASAPEAQASTKARSRGNRPARRSRDRGTR